MFFGFGWVYIIKQLFKNLEVREVHKSCSATMGVFMYMLYNVQNIHNTGNTVYVDLSIDS